MKKIISLISVMALALACLCGCESEANAEINATTLCISDDGSVKATYVEDFSQPYYDSEELKEMLDEEVADFNFEAGTEKIRVDLYEVTGNTARLEMFYADTESYCDFEEATLFIGTVSEAVDAGYSFDTSLTNVTMDKTIGEADILEMGSDNVVIADTDVRIRINKKIKYLSEEVSLISKYEVDAYENTGETILIF